MVQVKCTAGSAALLAVHHIVAIKEERRTLCIQSVRCQVGYKIGKELRDGITLSVFKLQRCVCIKQASQFHGYAINVSKGSHQQHLFS